MKKNMKHWLLVILICLFFVTLSCNFVTDALNPSETDLPPITLLPTSTTIPEITETAIEIPIEVPEVTEPEEPESDVTIDSPETLIPIPEGEIGVAALNAYQDEWESWIVSGLVLNNTERAIDGLEIEVDAFDPEGNSLYEEIAYGDLYSIMPGETNTFSLWVWEDLPVGTEFTANIVGFSSTEIQRAEISIQGTVMAFGDGNVNITGELVNDNDFPVDIDGLAAATFTSEGELMTAGADDVAISYLFPGESGPFRISMETPGVGADNIADFKIYSNIEVAYEEDFHDLSFLEETDYIDSDGDFHLVGEIQNNSDVHLNIDLVAAIYDLEGNVIDASNVDMPLYSLAPGEQTVYDFYSWGPINTNAGSIDQADNYEVKVDWGWTWETDTRYIDLSADDSGYEFDSFWGLTFTGFVTNNTGGEVDGGKVIIILRDRESGNIVAIGYETIFETIPVGEVVEYTVLVEVMEGINLEQIEYSIIAKGEIP